ncbi:MAG: hypothetical protein ABIQ01_10380 [Pseudolysinimonas sp.]
MTSWVHHVARLTGAPAAAVPEHPVFLWQLLAANHRVLARGSNAHDSLDEAKEDVTAVVDARERLAARMVRLESNRGYGWMLLREFAPVLTCARWYTLERNRRESLHNARIGLDLLAMASRLDVDVAVGIDVGVAVAVPAPVPAEQLVQIPLVVDLDERL